MVGNWECTNSKVVNTNQGLSCGVGMDRKLNYIEKLLGIECHTGPRNWIGPLDPPK